MHRRRTNLQSLITHESKFIAIVSLSSLAPSIGARNTTLFHSSFAIRSEKSKVKRNFRRLLINIEMR